MQKQFSKEKRDGEKRYFGRDLTNIESQHAEPQAHANSSHIKISSGRGALVPNAVKPSPVLFCKALLGNQRLLHKRVHTASNSEINKSSSIDQHAGSRKMVKLSTEGNGENVAPQYGATPQNGAANSAYPKHPFNFQMSKLRKVAHRSSMIGQMQNELESKENLPEKNAPGLSREKELKLSRQKLREVPSSNRFACLSFIGGHPPKKPVTSKVNQGRELDSDTNLRLQNEYEEKMASKEEAVAIGQMQNELEEPGAIEVWRGIEIRPIWKHLISRDVGYQY